MDDRNLDRLIADRLGGRFADSEPPPELGARVLAGTVARRRRRRNRIYLAAAAMVLVLAAVSGLRAMSDANDVIVDPEPAPPSRLTDLVREFSVVTIPRQLPGGAFFFPLALGTDGTVLGVSVRTGADGAPAIGRGVWRAGPKQATPERIQDTPAETVSSLWTMAAGEGIAVWPNGERLQCLGPGDGRARTIGEKWGGRQRFFTDRGQIVWSNEGDSLTVAAGCGGPAKTLPVKGELEAFAYPHAFVWSDGRLLQVDIQTGQVGPTPVVRAAEFKAKRTGFAFTEPEAFAANRDVIAGLERVLAIVTRRGGEVRPPIVPPQSMNADHKRYVTAGDRVVAYTAEHDDFELSEALVYDLRSGRQFRVREAWAAGGRLLWRDGEVYRLAQVRSL